MQSRGGGLPCTDAPQKGPARNNTTTVLPNRRLLRPCVAKKNHLRMGIGMTLLHHSGFTGLSRRSHDTSGESVMM